MTVVEGGGVALAPNVEKVDKLRGFQSGPCKKQERKSLITSV